MDTLTIKNFRCAGKHGCFAAERNEETLFEVSAVLHANLQSSCKTDKLDETIDYPAVMGIIEGVIKGESVKLIERLADKIAERLFIRFSNLLEVDVRVTKRVKDLPYDFDGVCVEISRKRGEYLNE